LTVVISGSLNLPPTSRYCRWWRILYSSARNCCLAFYKVI